MFEQKRVIVASGAIAIVSIYYMNERIVIMEIKSSPYNCCNLCAWEIGHIRGKPIQTAFLLLPLLAQEYHRADRKVI